MPILERRPRARKIPRSSRRKITLLQDEIMVSARVVLSIYWFSITFGKQKHLLNVSWKVVVYGIVANFCTFLSPFVQREHMCDLWKKKTWENSPSACGYFLPTQIASCWQNLIASWRFRCPIFYYSFFNQNTPIIFCEN